MGWGQKNIETRQLQNPQPVIRYCGNPEKRHVLWRRTEHDRSLFLNLKIIFLDYKGLPRVHLQGIHKRIAVYRSHILDNLKELVRFLCEIHLAFFQQLFFQRGPVVLRHASGPKQGGHLMELSRTTDHRDRFFGACPIDPVEPLRRWQREQGTLRHLRPALHPHPQASETCVLTPA